MKSNTHQNMNMSLRQKLSSLKPKKTMVQEAQAQPLQQSETKSDKPMAATKAPKAPEIKQPKMENNATVPGVNKPLEKMDRQPVPKKKVDVGAAPANVGQNIPKAAAPEFAAEKAPAPAAAPAKAVKMKATKAPASKVSRPAPITAKPAKVAKKPAVKVVAASPKQKAPTVKQMPAKTQAHHDIKAKLGTKKAINTLKEKATASASTEGKLAAKKVQAAKKTAAPKLQASNEEAPAPALLEDKPAPTAAPVKAAERPSTLPTKSLQPDARPATLPTKSLQPDPVKVESGKGANFKVRVNSKTAKPNLRPNVDVSKAPAVKPEATAKDPFMKERMRAQEATQPERTADPTPAQKVAGETTQPEKTETATRKDPSIPKKMAQVARANEKTLKPSVQDVNHPKFGVIKFLRSFFNTKKTAGKVNQANQAAYAKSDDTEDDLKKKI